MRMNNESKIAAWICDTINRFEKINLEDLSEGAQMERIDRKYPFHITKLPQVLMGLEKYYKIVNAFGKTISPYDTLYLDTPDLNFYHIHHNGILHRDKVRFRSYPHTQTTFLEVKRKSNKSRTAKWRIPVEGIRFPLTDSDKIFLKDHLSANVVNDLKPSVRVKYYRMAFNSDTEEERFSIDFEITATRDQQKSNFGNVAILEVKQDHMHTSPIINQMRKLGIGEGGMSKYCIHLALLEKKLKSNLFKPAIRSLKKIKHE